MATATSLAEARSHNTPPEVFLRHWREIRDCKQAHADTGMALARAKKSAKSAGIDMDAFKDVEKWSELDDDELRIRREKAFVYAGWLKLPIGTQAEFFGRGLSVPQPNDDAREEHTEWQAGDNGLKAGKAGTPRDQNPHQPGDKLFVAWDKAWSKGNKDFLKQQKQIASEMGENAENANGSGRRRRGAAAESAAAGA
jgi:hypothetical protein